MGSYGHRIVALPPALPMSTICVPKLASDAFSHCAIPAPRRILPSPKSAVLEDETAIEPCLHAGAILVSSSGAAFKVIPRIYMTEETAIEPRPYAGAIVVSSSGADVAFQCLSDLKSLISKEDLKFLKKLDELYILLCVERSFKPVVGEIKEVTTRNRVLQSLSENKTATLEITDLHNLNGFLGLTWKDIQKKLTEIKKGLKFILYVKQKGLLTEAIETLHLGHIYLFCDRECGTGEERCRLLKVGNFVS